MEHQLVGRKERKREKDIMTMLNYTQCLLTALQIRCMYDARISFYTIFFSTRNGFGHSLYITYEKIFHF